MSTYKRPIQLKKQLEQILLQEYPHIEIVVSDNDPEASASEAVKMINDDRVKYFHNAENLGMVKSFNASVARSRGDYIVMVTDDDPVYPYMLRVLTGLRLQYPGYGVYAGCGDWIVETDFSAQSLNEQVGAKRTTLAGLPEDGIMKISASDFPGMYLDGPLTSSFLLWSCCMVERSIIEEIKGMPDYGSELLTDHGYMLAAGSKKGMLFVNKPMGGQSIRGDNFGFDFDRVKEKYLSTPRQFYNYVSPHLQYLAHRDEIDRKLWNFIGRAWVEYSLMIFRSLKEKKTGTREFFSRFKQVFRDNKIAKWKWKFYLKAYFGGLFKLLLKLKPR